MAVALPPSAHPPADQVADQTAADQTAEQQRTADTPGRYDIAVVIITQAKRPTELDTAIASVRRQRGISVQLVLVMQGAAPPEPDPSDRLIILEENVGIPAGRNIGAAAAQAPVVMFLDDDAELIDDDLLATVTRRFAGDGSLGAMAIRLVDEQGETQRRHVPRLGSGSATRSGPVTHFIGAACVVRADAFEEVTGFDPRFFYAMEESDLSWRLLDAGWTIWYSADLRAFHPRTAPSRHQDYVVLTARNRFWMTWRSLPAPLLAGHLLAWTIVALLRGAPAGQLLAGYRQAVAALPRRRPMRWRTALRMTSLGRPPIL